MRTPINMISPLILFWSMIYVLALLSIYTAGMLACLPGVKRFVAKRRTETPAGSTAEPPATRIYYPSTLNPMGQQ